jgi:anti-sigma B factor antagonist
MARGHELKREPAAAGEFILAASGELDLNSIVEFREHLAHAVQEGASSVLLDLSGVGFIDSLSLAAVVGLKRRLEGHGHVAVVAGDPYLLLILEAGGLESVIDVFADRGSALAHLRGAPASSV